MSRAKALPPEFQQPFAVRDALATGIPRNRLNASDLVAPFHGARMPRPTTTEGDKYEQARAALLASCAGYLPVGPDGFAFSHVTAARLYGMPLPPTLDGRRDLDVAVPAGRAATRRVGVRGHRMSPNPGRAILGFPVVAPELAWLQLAPLLTLDELIVAGDHLVRRKRPASSLELLRSRVGHSIGARGRRRAVDALRDIRAGTDSPMESKTRLIIVRGGLPEPRVGYRVLDGDGFFVGTPDLAYIAEKIAIEYEGDIHRTNRRTFSDDIERRELFEWSEWRVLRVTNTYIDAPWRLVSRVRDLLRLRTTQL